jgi:hypothetical protein
LRPPSSCALAIRRVGSCKLKLGVEKRGADDFAYAMALGPRIGPLAEEVGARVLAPHGSHADFKCLLEPTRRPASSRRKVGVLAQPNFVEPNIMWAQRSTFEVWMADAARYVVAIVVDPDFGDRLAALLDRMPVWIADTEANQAASRAHWEVTRTIGHTSTGALTTFKVDIEKTPESWCLDVLNDVAGHHDRYFHSPGYSAVEVYGAAPSARLVSALAGVQTDRDHVAGNRRIPRQYA